jgi:hypothetical protein
MMQRWAHLILSLGQPLQPLQSLLLRQTLMMNPAGINRARFIRCRFARNGAFALFVLVNAGRDASYLTAYAPDGPGRAWSLVKKVSRVGWGQLELFSVKILVSVCRHAVSDKTARELLLAHGPAGK